MVAEMVHEVEPLSLLFPPDRPKPHGRAVQGYRRIWKRDRGVMVGRLERRFDDDEYGALVQHAIVLYVMGHVRRPDVAAMLAVSETTAQSVVRGGSWGPYGRPVLRALKRLGITKGRASATSIKRNSQLRAASQTLMRRTIDALEGPPIPLYDRDKLVADLYLLTVASEAKR